MNKLLYISNWSYKDGLTQSTVLPSLKVLANSERWDKIIFTSLESHLQHADDIHPKIEHRPFCMLPGKFRMLDRFVRWEKYRQFLKETIVSEEVTTLIARGAPAGINATILAKGFGIPLYVESFEPHADYMAESGVWKRWDPRYLKQKAGEKKVIDKAHGLITVSENYKRFLQKQGVPQAKVQVVPCTVDTDLFQFNPSERISIRKRLNIPPEALVGINVGKYGGIYHDEKAFELFKYLFQNIRDYHQVFLTPDCALVQRRVKDYDLPEDRCKIATVSYNDVSKYLSAADVGFVLVKSTPAKRFCSAIKTGEYWACGLPVIITENIGDESNIISETETGVVWDALHVSLPMVLKKIKMILAQEGVREKNLELASLHRNRRIITEVYSYFQLI